MNLKPILEKLHKQGSYGGQCYTFLHRLVEFPPVGNSLAAKKQALKRFGIPIGQLDSIKVGDIVLTNESFYFGHGALVNYIDGNNLQLTESNFNLNLKVSHTRLLPVYSKAILGVFRKPFKFIIPEPNFPIQIHLDILMNRQPFWNSLLQHMANLQDWYWQASGQRIQLIIDYRRTNLSDWPVVVTGDGFGPKYKVIKPEWFKENVLPLAPEAKIAIFCVPKKDGLGPMVDDPTLYELGYAYPSKDLPGQIMIAHDEHDDYAPYYPKLGAFAKICAHEISHVLYKWAAGPMVVPGGDYTHNHFYGNDIIGSSMTPENIFKEIDYLALSQKVNS